MRIFIIEDDPIYAEFVAASLSQTPGRQVSVYPTAEDGLTAVEAETPEVVISDFRLPGMSGIDFFEHVKPLLPKDSKFIMMSGLDDGMQVLGFIQKGLRDYVIKDERITESLNAIITGQDDALIY